MLICLRMRKCGAASDIRLPPASKRQNSKHADLRRLVIEAHTAREHVVQVTDEREILIPFRIVYIEVADLGSQKTEEPVTDEGRERGIRVARFIVVVVIVVATAAVVVIVVVVVIENGQI